MTTTSQKTQKEKAMMLKVFIVDMTTFYVESAEGKICYRVGFNDEKGFCTCADFVNNAKNNPAYQCKHIMAVLEGIPEGKAEKIEFLSKRRPVLDDRFIKNIENKDFVVYAGLLDLAHQKGLQKMEVELMQYPTKENNYLAVCRAVATSQNGEIFIDIGDASPNNCNNKVAKHIVRMASTRAKARCLRDMTNIGITALEELADFSDVLAGDLIDKKRTTRKTGGNGKNTSKSKTTTTNAGGNGSANTTASKPNASANGKGKPANQSEEPKMSEAQKRAVANLARRRGIGEEQLSTIITEKFNSSLEHLTSKNAAEFIRYLQTAA